MTDPRNIAHDKKIQQEKTHKHEDIAPGADETVQPGKKPHLHHEEKVKEQPEAAKTEEARAPR